MPRYRCPDNVRPDEPNEVLGCGLEFEDEPGADGWVDCPHCGIFFDPEEPTNQPQPKNKER